MSNLISQLFQSLTSSDTVAPPAQPVPAPPRPLPCPACGWKNLPDPRFCSGCGVAWDTTELEESAAEAIRTIVRRAAGGHPDRPVLIQEGYTFETVCADVPMSSWPARLLGPDFINDALLRCAALRNARMLLLAEPLDDLPAILPLLEQSVTTDQPIAIVAPAFEGELPATLGVNQMRGILECAPVEAAHDVIAQIAADLGGQVLTPTQLPTSSPGGEDSTTRVGELYAGRESLWVVHEDGPRTGVRIAVGGNSRAEIRALVQVARETLVGL